MSNIEITPELLANIKAKAEKATPGPWEAASCSILSPEYNDSHFVLIGCNDYDDEENDEFAYGYRNAAYIASTNQAVILDLIEDYEGKQQALYGIFLLVDQLKSCLNLEADVSVEITIQGPINQINHDDTAKKFEIKRLEKEANWLAQELAKFCSRTDCDECEHVGQQWEENTFCKVLSLGVNSPDTWRKAARKAVEMSGHEKN